MPEDSSPLTYRSTNDAVGEDAHALHRSFRTWAILCVVWVVGLIVWAGYVAGIVFVVFRVL